MIGILCSYLSVVLSIAVASVGAPGMFAYRATKRLFKGPPLSSPQRTSYWQISDSCPFGLAAGR